METEIIKLRQFTNILYFGINKNYKEDSLEITFLGGDNSEEPITKDDFEAIIFSCNEQLKEKKI